MARLKTRAHALSLFPGRGRAVPELESVGDTRHRELVERPYRIVYRVEGDVMFVLAVVDGRRNLEDPLFERLTRP